MDDSFLLIEDPSAPRLLAETKDFALVYKPPRVHSAPETGSSGGTVLDWCLARFPELAALEGRKPGEGGLLHRLDYETQGLLLFGKSSLGMESLLEQQKEGKILKEYSALTAESKAALPGFPAGKPDLPPWVFSGEAAIPEPAAAPAQIASAFRPYGPGRKAVRPVADSAPKGKGRSGLYTTRILAVRLASASHGIFSFRIEISKGFRHQIRNHLAWIGRPILNDKLYGGVPAGKGLLALRASSIIFFDPSSGAKLKFSIPPLNTEIV